MLPAQDSLDKQLEDLYSGVDTTIDADVSKQFSVEMEAFRKDLPELLKHDKGKWIAYCVGEEPIGPLTVEEDCFNMAWKAWGTEKFLVRQISEDYLHGKDGRTIHYRHGIDEEALAKR